MTILIGQAFDAFTLYTLSAGASDSEAEKQTLRRSIGSVSLRLILIGLATTLLSLLSHTLWSIYGARVCEKLQIKVYQNLSARHVSWFDNGLQNSHNHQLPPVPTDQPEDPDGSNTSAAAGVMSRFSRSVLVSLACYV